MVVTELNHNVAFRLEQAVEYQLVVEDLCRVIVVLFHELLEHKLDRFVALFE